MAQYSNIPTELSYEQPPVGTWRSTEPKVQPFEIVERPLMSPQLAEPRGRLKHSISGRTRDLFDKWWLWEIASSFIAVLFLMATFLLLVKVNNMPYYDGWTIPWSINSVIATLMTVVKAAMLIPVTAGLGQLKWIWFSSQTQSRPLEHMDKFDKASRGSGGSLMLLATLRFRHLASLGAFLTVASLAIDTLTQNAVTTRRIPFADPKHEPWVPRSNAWRNYTMYNDGQNNEDFGAPPAMVAAMYYGMFSASGYRELRTAFPYSCPTGDCTFDPYRTLGVCSKCNDVTNLLDTTAIPSTVMLKSNGFLNITAYASYPDPSAMVGIGPLITNMYAVGRATLDTSPLAAECVLYWCVPLFDNTTFRHGELHEPAKEWTDTSATTKYGQPDDITLTLTDCDSDCSYEISSEAQLGLQNFFLGSKTGLHGSIYMTSESGSTVDTEFAQAVSSLTDHYEFLTAVDRTMTTLAKAMTNMIRVQPKEHENNFDTKHGISYSYFWHVRWGYMAFPTMLVFTSAIFLALTIFRSRNHEPWKSNALALLFHGLSVPDRTALGPAPRLVDMKKAAKHYQVHMEHTVEGQKLVGVPPMAQV